MWKIRLLRWDFFDEICHSRKSEYDILYNEIMTSINDLEKEILLIKARNKKVETDKAWETSWARKLLLVTFTYLGIGFYLQAINIDKPWLNAIVPSVGFLLSTFTLPFFKKIWEKYIHH